MPGKSDQLAVTRVIDRFDAGDRLHQPGIVFVDVLDQLALCIGRTRDENRMRVRNRRGDRMQKFFIGRHVTAAD